METKASRYPLIEKETIPELQFDQEDVLTDQEAQKRRLYDLDRGSRLGNAYQGKVEIVFKVASGDVFRVRTTIWQADKDFATIKAGVTLPTRSIYSVEFF